MFKFIYEYVRLLAYKLDTSPRIKVLMVLFELAIAGIAFFLQEYSNSVYHSYFINAFWAILVLLILSHLLIAYFGYSDKINILVYDEKHGMLYDKTRKIPNVSLRRKTLKIIFSAFAKDSDYKNLVMDAGYACGKDFYYQFKTIETTGELTINKSDLLQKILEYDSSSGMGKYHLNSVSTDKKMEISINILNPFLDRINDNKSLCTFLIFYVKAIVEEIYINKTFKYEVKSITNTSEDDLHDLFLLKFIEKG